MDPGPEENIGRAVALAAAIEAAKAAGADGTFDDTSYMVVPSITATA